MGEGWKKWGAIIGLGAALEGGIVAKEKYEEQNVAAMSAEEKEAGASNIVAELESMIKENSGADRSVALKNFEANKGILEQVLDNAGKSGTRAWKSSKHKDQIIMDLKNLLEAYKESIADERGNERVEDAQAEIARMAEWIGRIEAGNEEKF